jgi:hypothetical protein
VRQPACFDDDPSQTIIALEAVPIHSSYRYVTSRLMQDDAEVNRYIVDTSELGSEPSSVPASD